MRRVGLGKEMTPPLLLLSPSSSSSLLLLPLYLSLFYQSLCGVNVHISRTGVSLRMEKRKRQRDGADIVVNPDAFHGLIWKWDGWKT